MKKEIEEIWAGMEYGYTYDNESEIEYIAGLRDIALSNWEQSGINIPESDIKLFVAMIIRAGKDKDRNYFLSESFSLHCRITKLHPPDIIKMCQYAWKKEEESEQKKLTN